MRERIAAAAAGTAAAESGRAEEGEREGGGEPDASCGGRGNGKAGGPPPPRRAEGGRWGGRGGRLAGIKAGQPAALVGPLARRDGPVGAAAVVAGAVDALEAGTEGVKGDALALVRRDGGPQALPQMQNACVREVEIEIY
jgi:hypothetical protein